MTGYDPDFRLADTTRYKLYVIPSLSVAMIGNGRYTLPDEFHSAFDPVFDALSQAPVEGISSSIKGGSHDEA